MVAALPLPAERVPDRLSAEGDTAGLPGYCCVPGCGWPAPTQLCKRCFHVFAGADGALPRWLVELRREATRLAVREYRARRQGVCFMSYDFLTDFLLLRELHPEETLAPLRSHDDDGRALAAPPRPFGGTAVPRRLHRRGAAAPPLAPQVTEVVTGPDALASLRRYSDSGVPLDMPGFLRLLHALFGWPPPGTTVDARHKEALVDLYEKVYEA